MVAMIHTMPRAERGTGAVVIVVEHVTRLREDLRPDWPQPAQPGGSYRVEIAGEPSYTVDICPTSRKLRSGVRTCVPMS